jgi:phage/plasmid-associated DNA primase
LWNCCTREVYGAFIPDFFVAAYKKYTDDDDNDELLKKVKKQITKFDSDRYHTTILKRSTGKLQNNQFVKQLNMQTHLFPIRNGRKIDLRTLEITDRTKEDYFTFESPIDFVKDKPNADKFFNQVHTDRVNREYVRKCLGYMMTGDTSAQVFFIWYGKGRNGKSVIANMMKAILSEKFYHQCDKSIFIKTQKGQGASPKKIALIGTRLVMYSEGETADEIQLNFSSLKEISGEDEINARGLFKDPINFRTQCKLNMLTNYVPPLDGQDAIKILRTRFIFHDSQFVDKPKGKNEFKKNEKFVNELTTEHFIRNLFMDCNWCSRIFQLTKM